MLVLLASVPRFPLTPFEGSVTFCRLNGGDASLASGDPYPNPLGAWFLLACPPFAFAFAFRFQLTLALAFESAHIVESSLAAWSRMDCLTDSRTELGNAAATEFASEDVKDVGLRTRPDVQ